MKITIIGVNTKKEVDFDDIPLALRLSNGKIKYYHIKGASISTARSSKSRNFIEALIKRGQK